MNLAKILGQDKKSKAKTTINPKKPSVGGNMGKKSIVSPIEVIPEEEEADFEDKPTFNDNMPARHRAATLVDIEMEADSDLDEFEENN